VWAHTGAIGLASAPPEPVGRPRQSASGIRGPKRRFPIGDFRRDNVVLLARERSSHEISDAVDRRAVGTVPSLSLRSHDRLPRGNCRKRWMGLRVSSGARLSLVGAQPVDIDMGPHIYFRNKIFLSKLFRGSKFIPKYRKYH
jgi:hypothetical protein